jgi:Flp pilus assembly protein TadG
MFHRQSVRRAPRPASALDRHIRGQAMIEFAAVLLPLLMIVVGIIQFGLIFGANVSLTNAAREGARAGTVFLYSGTDKIINDRDRCTAVLQGTKSSFGLIAASSPYFVAADPCTSGHRVNDYTWRNGDLTITYCRPTSSPSAADDCAASSTVLANDARRGYRMTVTLTYRSDIIVPFVGEILATDANGRLVQTARATMVIN